MTAAETSADDVLRRFCTSPGTQRVYKTWLSDPRRENVAPVVLAHRTRLIYELAPGDVREVCQGTVHALGDVKRRDGEAVSAIVDWHPDFAFTHVFHVCTEQMGKLPTYQEFRDYSWNTPLGLKMIGNPAREKLSEVAFSEIPEWLARAAVRWRIGNAYYSFLREVYTVVELRSRGVDLRVHPLADALFRVDAWTRSRALSLLVGNKKFRQGETSGRKKTPQQLLADVDPPFEFSVIELKAATVFGSVHLPSRDLLDRAAAQLISDR